MKQHGVLLEVKKNYLFISSNNIWKQLGIKEYLNVLHEYFPLPFSFTFLYLPPHPTPPIFPFPNFKSFKIRDGKCEEETERSTARNLLTENYSRVSILYAIHSNVMVI